ncbi:unnamed protein product [Ectocarpus sp. 8 AP-2014]
MLSVFCLALTVGFRFLHLWSDFCDEKLSLLSWSVALDKKPPEMPLCQLLVWHGGEGFPAARIYRMCGLMRVRTPLLVEVRRSIAPQEIKSMREKGGRALEFV